MVAAAQAANSKARAPLSRLADLVSWLKLKQQKIKRAVKKI
jgi:hypothetical protein